ncbi:pentapeptide repeat-containing protein [Streptomyces sp. NPDC002643]
MDDDIGLLYWSLVAMAGIVVVVAARLARHRIVVRAPGPFFAAVRLVVRARPRDAVLLHRAALRVRREYAASAVPDRRELFAQRGALVEAERTARVIGRARVTWLVFLCLLTPVVAWLILLGASIVLSELAKSYGDGDSPSSTEPDGLLVVFALVQGAVLGLLLTPAAVIRRDPVRLMAWRPEPPILLCARALVACGAAGQDRTRTARQAQLDHRVAELRRSLWSYARHGHTTSPERRDELVAHARAVGRRLHEAEGAVWREPATALAELVRLLGAVNDAMHKGRWLSLLDETDLPEPDPAPVPDTDPPVPVPPPVPHLGFPAWDATVTGGRESWTRTVQQAAILLPAVAAVGALVFSSITVQQAGDSLRITEHGAISTRFDTAVDNLDDKSLDVRLGGLLMLERIIEDSPRDRGKVLTLVCAYVQSHTPVTGRTTPGGGAGAEERVAEDVRTAVRIVAHHAPEDSAPEYDLSGIRVPGLDLTGVGDFGYSDFSGSQLPGAQLYGLSMYGVDFRDADLTRADLQGADLLYADLRGAHLRRANLRGADLTGADLGGADLTKADLTGADLTGANLDDVTYSSDTKWPRDYEPPKSARLG